MELMNQIIARAKQNKQRIVLPEGTEERTLKAADMLLADQVADLILIGNTAEIASKAAEWGLKNIDKATIIDPENNPKSEEYANLLKNELYTIPALSNVKILGTQKEEIAVNIDNDRLSAYGVNSTLMTFDYQTAAMQTLSGKFKSDYINAPIHIEGKLSTEQEIKDRIIWSAPTGASIVVANLEMFLIFTTVGKIRK